MDTSTIDQAEEPTTGRSPSQPKPPSVSRPSQPSPAQPSPEEVDVEPMSEREVDLSENEDKSTKDSPEDVLNLLKPKSEVRQWKIGKDDYERQYTQRPLSFIAKMEWFSLVGGVLDRALSGENAMSLNNLFSAPGGRPQDLSMADFRDADTFVQAIGKLMVYAPDFLLRSYCIWLGVPDFEREIAIQIMRQVPEDGGLTDDDGIEIIEVFIDQNYEALDSFFREKLSQLQNRMDSARERGKDKQAGGRPQSTR